MLKFIIEVFLFFMFIRLVAPFLLRMLLSFFFKKAVKSSAFGQAQQAQHAYQQQQQSQRQNQPGSKIKIDYIPEELQKERKEFAGGEYVDYEEVK